MSAPDTDGPGFVIDEVPGGDSTEPRYTWCLLDRRGDVLARAPEAYGTREEVQVAIAKVKLCARSSDVPTHSDQTTGA